MRDSRWIVKHSKKKESIEKDKVNNIEQITQNTNTTFFNTTLNTQSPKEINWIWKTGKKK